MIVSVLILFNIFVMVCSLLAVIFAMKEGIRSMRLILFGFAVACGFLSNVYWLIYDFMYPDKIMPFAANEIAEWALFMLLGASLVADLPKKRINPVQEILLATLFVAGNTGVWILASGEWVQDILTGLTLGYFICCIMYRMRYSEQFTKLAWRILACAALAVLVTQYICMLADAPYAVYAENVCYAVLLIGIVFLLVSSVKELTRGKNPELAVCLSYGMIAWCLISMYLGSSDLFYGIAYASCSVAIILTMIAMRKEVLSR